MVRRFKEIAGRYIEKIIGQDIKDYKGNTLSEEVGSIYQAADGTWWIA